jgi:hypothetical protein
VKEMHERRVHEMQEPHEGPEQEVKAVYEYEGPEHEVKAVHEGPEHGVQEEHEVQEMDEAKEAPEARHQVYRRKQTAPDRTEEMPPIHGPYTGSSLRPSTPPHDTLLDICSSIYGTVRYHQHC